jgi:hypothetical protein
MKGGMPVAEELTIDRAADAILRAGGFDTERRDLGMARLPAPADSRTMLLIANDERRRAGLKAAAVLDAVGFDSLVSLARIIGSAYPNDPGTSDLDDSQPVSISLGVVRQAWAALAKVDR